MTLDACIAHAIHSDLDILRAVPQVHELAVDELEPYIEEYVTTVHQSIYHTILEDGEPYMRSKDAAGLCATLIETGITVPADMLLKMCQTILQLSEIEARFILDTEDGQSLYYMKMEVGV